MTDDPREAFEEAWNEFMKDVEPHTIRILHIRDDWGYRYDFDRDANGSCGATCGAVCVCCKGFEYRSTKAILDISLFDETSTHGFALYCFDDISTIWTTVGRFEEGRLDLVEQTIHFERKE